ncbi:MAG: hypothetical protein IJV37_05915 [Bacteroidales bacterium]|nr:hypothetical protein [Bacteroidales bacterium]
MIQNQETHEKTAAALAACQSPEAATSPDVRAFGLTGDVKSVSYSLEHLVPSETPGTEPEYEVFFEDEPVLAFDAQGRIILYDNILPLDDHSGAEEIDYEHYVKLEISYDAQGRIDLMDSEGWESLCQTKYIYEGDRPYPFRELYDLQYEGMEDDGAIEYEYTAFDKKGNWTERFYTSTIKTTASWDEESGPDIHEDRYRERRVITYWSDKR